MNQTDRIITAIVIVIAFACMFFLTKEYYPQIVKYNKAITECRNNIEYYKRCSREKTSAFEQDVRIAQNKEQIDQYEKARSPKAAIVAFGNLGIIIIAMTFKHFLVTRKP